MLSVISLRVFMGIAMMVAIPTWSYADETATKDSKPAHSGQMDHSKMGGMKGMGDMSMTGDVDYDFAVNVRRHHQTAADMAESELKNGKDPQMESMAKNIISSRKKEIDQFDKWLVTHKQPQGR